MQCIMEIALNPYGDDTAFAFAIAFTYYQCEWAQSDSHFPILLGLNLTCRLQQMSVSLFNSFHFINTESYRLTTHSDNIFSIETDNPIESNC